MSHDHRAPWCWSNEDYAETEPAHHPENCRVPAPCGIITVTALWPLCRYRHKAHWCGAPSRLDRKKGARFGDQAYAYEELVAEIGSAILCAEAGIANEPRADHAQYLAGWLRVLKADSRAIFSAASEASKAVDYVLSCGALVERAQAA